MTVTESRPLAVGALAAESAAAAPAPTNIGIPLPLGLAGFGMTAILLSAINAGVFDKEITPVVLPTAFVLGGVVVMLAGMWAFARGETFPAVALSALGSFWIIFSLLEKYFVPTIPAEKQGQAVGAYLLLWTVFAVAACIPASKTTVAVFAVTIGTAVTFLVLALANFNGSEALTTVGGVTGLLTGLIAVYTATAVLSNDMYGREMMPVRHL